jgi:hypothetical protein
MSIRAEIEIKNNRSETIYAPSFEQLADEINKLDGTRYALLIKNDKVEWEVFSLVKKEDYFLCFYYSDDEYYLVNPSITENDEWEVDMPDTTVRPAKYFNDLHTILIATKTYLETGQMDNTLTWEIWE